MVLFQFLRNFFAVVGVITVIFILGWAFSDQLIAIGIAFVVGGVVLSWIFCIPGQASYHTKHQNDP